MSAFMASTSDLIANSCERKSPHEQDRAARGPIKEGQVKQRA